jgi:hypothetical protein
MADLQSLISKINDLEVNVDKPLSQALMAKIGQNINALIDKFNVVVFNSSNPSWIVPPGVNFIQVLMVGGGGGGGGSGSTRTPATGPSASGAGGNSGQIVFTSFFTNPGDELSITIGNGGAGGAGGAYSPSGNPGAAGQKGGNTTVTGPNISLIAEGGFGGGGGQGSIAFDQNYLYFNGSNPGLTNTTALSSAGGFTVLGGKGGNYNSPPNSSWPMSPPLAAQRSCFFNFSASVGANGTFSGAHFTQLGAAGGGAGASGLGLGGNGGKGEDRGSFVGPATAGSNAAPNSGGGGGGGGGRRGDVIASGLAGGNGGSGKVIFLFTPDQI